MVSFYSILALFLIAISAIAYRRDEPTPLLPLGAPSRMQVLAFALVCATLCVVFGVQTGLNDRAILSQVPVPEWFQQLPLLFYAPHPPFDVKGLRELSLIPWAQFLSVVETALLYTIYRILRRTDCGDRRLITVALFGMVALALVAIHSLTSSVDVYAYIAGGLLWPHEYATPKISFPGEDGWINFMWGMPIIPSPYGPLWSSIVRLALEPATTLWQQAMAIRLIGLLSVAICIFCVYRLLGGSVAVPLFALNPALYNRYVMHAHNDIAGAAFILAASLAKRRTWLAVLLIAAAGTIKYPLLICGAIVFWDRPTLKERLIPALVSGSLGVGATFALGGSEYIAGLRRVYVIYDHSPPVAQQILHVVLFVVAVAAVGLALFRQTFLAGAAWSFPSLGFIAHPQYLVWGVPYALLGNASPIGFLLLWPVIDYAITFEYAATDFFSVERTALVIGLVATMAFALAARSRDARQRSVTTP